MGSSVRLAVAAFAACITFGAARRAEAHKVGLSRGDYVLHDATVDAELVFEKGELAQLVPLADVDHDGALDRGELTSGKAAIDRGVVQRIVVKGDGADCRGELVDAAPVEGDGVMLHARYVCAKRPQSLGVEIGIFGDLAHGHRHLAAVKAGGASTDAVSFAGQPTFALQVGTGDDTAAPGPHRAAESGAFAMFLLGVEHILTGYDHLVFLLGLVLVGGRVRSLIGVVTAFTVAHSITLALAALGVWAPSPRFVEPAIALSIAYVGIENFFVKNAEKRWRITFPFGLIHGFGFAGALAEIELPRAKVPLALLMFNLGVEAGQLAALALVLPLVILGLRHDWFRARVTRPASAAITLAGVAWFIARVVSLPHYRGRSVTLHLVIHA